jgi:acyl-CoA thioester hydrolase
MFKQTVNPRFGDVDVLGHVNNTVPAAWFELARMPFIKLFDPQLRLTPESFPFIMAHTDYDFIDQIYLQNEVEIKTWVSRIGTKSFTAYHEAWQQERLCVKGSAVIVCFDFNSKQTMPIPQDKRKLLEEHLLEK